MVLSRGVNMHEASCTWGCHLRPLLGTHPSIFPDPVLFLPPLLVEQVVMHTARRLAILACHCARVEKQDKMMCRERLLREHALKLWLSKWNAQWMHRIEDSRWAGVTSTCVTSLQRYTRRVFSSRNSRNMHRIMLRPGGGTSKLEV